MGLLTKSQSTLDNQRSEIFWLRILFLIAIAVGVFYNTKEFDEQSIRCYQPDNKTTQAWTRAGVINDTYAYGFALRKMQDLYIWNRDGAIDFTKNIIDNQYFLTHTFRQYLLDEKKRKQANELNKVKRIIIPIPGHGYAENRVKKLTEDTYLVWLDLRVEDSIDGKMINEMYIRYPIKVIKYDIPPEKNPDGLALDGYMGAGPERIDDEIKKEQSL